MWCVSDLDDEYIRKMEDVLAVYELPLDPREPVVSLDEKPVPLRADARPDRPMRPGRVRRRDYEYVRCGTANVYCAVESLAGRHMLEATKNRKAPTFARMMRRIARSYPRARTIHLVMDNLTAHGPKALVDTFGKRDGLRLWRRFSPHFTPKHGSWLNQAELQISMFARQGLGTDRIPSFDDLRRRARGWQKDANRKRTKIRWTFTRAKARTKFKYTPNADLLASPLSRA